MLAVSRALGDTQFKAFNGSPAIVSGAPDTRIEAITPTTEFMILATDGLWDVMTPQSAVTFVRRKISSKGGDLSKIADDLASEALLQGSIDNVTVIILVFNLMCAEGSDEGSEVSDP